MRWNLYISSVFATCLAASAFFQSTAFAGTVNLTAVDFRQSTWSATGADVLGTLWSAPLTFTAFEKVGDNYNLAGFFEWTGNDGQSGKEEFNGTLFANMSVELIGDRIVESPPGVPPVGVVPAQYFGTLSFDEESSRLILTGEFTGQGVAQGVWSANVAIPEPASFVLAALGGILLIVRFKRFQRFSPA